MKKFQASEPPTGYSWSISQNENNTLNVASRSVLITLSEAAPEPDRLAWSTSVSCISPMSFIYWESATVAFLTPQGTIRVWSPFFAEYRRNPIDRTDDVIVLGDDVIDQVSISINGQHVAVQTSDHDLVFFTTDGELLHRFVRNPSRELPTRFLFLHGFIFIKFLEAEEPCVYDRESGTLHRNVKSVTAFTPDAQEELSKWWETMCRFDDLS